MKNVMKAYRLVFSSIVLVSIALFSSTSIANCPEWLNHTFKQLHSTNTINICERFSNKPLLIVNTASHCGFTHQFSTLEALHKQYKDQGLAVIGFSSNDFNQEAKTESKTASICYENYGVTFTMMAPISVKGDKAHPLFKSLAEKSQEPDWNFNKFLVDVESEAVEHFGSSTRPDSKLLNTKIKELL
jgi:glutathione peroxidase